MSTKQSNKKRATKAAEKNPEEVPPNEDVKVVEAASYTVEQRNGLEFCVDEKGNVMVLETIENFLKNSASYTGEYIREFAAQMNEYIDKDVLSRIPIEKLSKWRAAINPLGRTIEGSNSYLNCSIIQPNREFDMTLNLVGMQAYIMKALEEYMVPEGVPVCSIADFVDNPSILDPTPLMIEKNDRLAIAKFKYAKEAMKSKMTIYAFLESLFQFNPNEHVAPSYKPNNADQTRKPIRTKAAKVATDYLKKHDMNFRNLSELYDEMMKERGIDPATNTYIVPKTKKVKRTTKSTILSEDGKTTKQVTKTEIIDVPIQPPETSLDVCDYAPPIYDHSFLRVLDNNGNHLTDDGKYKDETLNGHITNMLMPLDTTARVKMYIKSNYEELLKLVNDMTGWKPDIQLLINPYSWHTNREDAELFVKKHSKEVIATVYTLDSGKWNLIANYKEIRDRVKFYSKDTKIFESILERVKQDEMMGNELLQKRVKKKKMENEIEAGKHADSFVKWAKKSEAIPDTNTSGMAEDDTPDDAVELPIWKCNPGSLSVVKDYVALAAEKPFVPSPDDDKQNT